MVDILLDETNDLIFEKGDLVLGESTLQHQKHILLANKGEYKEHPEVGVGIVNALIDEEPKSILIEIERQFKYDGMKPEILQFLEDGKLNIKAPYIQ